MGESKVVAAVGSAAGRSSVGVKVDPLNPTRGIRAKVMESVMAEAIAKAQSEGVTDQDEIRRRMLEARERAKALMDGANVR